MASNKLLKVAVTGALLAVGHVASAALVPVGIFNGNVGVSIDGIGSNSAPVGNVQASVPAGSTILAAYLYSAGTPFPWYGDSPTTLDHYNTAGITLAGTSITNFSVLVGATSTRPDIGQWFTARADVTALVQSLVAGDPGPDYSWSVAEGTKNTRIDGEALVIVYSNPSLPIGSVAVLDGGQNTGGETTNVTLGSPLGDPTAPGFEATMSLAISFSTGNAQSSTILVNESPLTQFAGGLDDGLQLSDGSLITVGGIGDDPSNNVASSADDDELYDLRSFLSLGDTSFSIFTQNPTNDDNIFLMSLYITGEIEDVNPPVPEPGSLALLGLGLAGLGIARRRRAG